MHEIPTKISTAAACLRGPNTRTSQSNVARSPLVSSHTKIRMGTVLVGSRPIRRLTPPAWRRVVARRKHIWIRGRRQSPCAGTGTYQGPVNCASRPTTDDAPSSCLPGACTSWQGWFDPIRSIVSGLSSACHVCLVQASGKYCAVQPTNDLDRAGNSKW